MRQSIFVFVLLAAICLVSSTAALAVPATPIVTWPLAGNLVQSDRPDIRWNGSGYDSYEVHIGTTNDPNNPNGWDSGQVYATDGTAMSGALTPQTTYYVFVRIHDASGWSSWSAYGDSFYVDGQLMGDPYWIDGGVGAHWQHVMCYNATRNEYLIAYYDCSGAKPLVAYYRLDGNGTKIGSEVTIPDDLDGSGDPAVCYNSARQEYLISYDGWRDSGGRELRTQRVNATNGALIGGSNYVYGLNALMLSRVAYSATSNCYLLVWDSNIAPGYVHAQRLDSTAVPIGSVFSVSGSHYWAGVNGIAYNSTDNEFLVTMQSYESDEITSWDVSAQRVRASDGALMGSNIIVSATTAGETGSDVAYDSNMNRYLVVYESTGPIPYAQFVSATGSLIGARFRFSSDDFYNGGMVSVCWSPVSGEFLVNWAHCCSSSLYGRRFSQTGSAIGEPFRINGTVQGFGVWNPRPVVNTATGEYLIAWFWQYDSIYVRRYHAYPPPAYAPGPVTNFAAGSGNTVVNLSWTNPTGAVFTGTMIRYRTDTYPTSPTDGTLVVDKAGTPGANDSYQHTGRTNGVTYYYTAFAHDVTPLYSSGVSAWAVPTAPTCYSDNFSYSDGALSGNGGWSGAATSSQIAINAQTVKIFAGTGAATATHTMSCGDPGQGYMWVDVKIQSGSGSSYMYSLWIDDAAGNNLARWYGSGTTARGRIGGTASVTAVQTLTGGWDDLAVKINPYTNTSEFFFNGVSLGALDHGQTGAGDVIGALRIERMSSTGPDYMSLDTILIGQPGDVTPPGNVTNFTATSGDTQNSLSWTNPGDSDLAGVKIMFKTTGYPTGPTDGTQCYSGTGTSTTHTGLTNGTTYYYKAFAYDTSNNYASGAQASAVPADVTAPGNATGFTATPGDTQNTLAWTKPGDADLAGVKIMFKTTGYPTGPADGTQCYSGLGTSYVHTTLTNGTTYYYKAFSFDEVPNYSSGAQASGVPADTVAPGNVTGFTATPGDTQNVLAWTKPGDADLAGVKIMFKTTGYPTGPADGTQCYSGLGTTYTHTGLTNGTTYYYKAFAFDEVPNYASGAQASATPAGASYCFRDQFTYANGALNGNGGWSGSATSAHISISSNMVKVTGGSATKDAVRTISCSTGSQTYIWVRCQIQKGSGANTIWSLYINDAAGANFARWYGTGTTARGRISGSGLVTATQTLTGGLDNIDVKIVPSAQTSEFFFNGVSLGALSYAGYATGSTIGQLRFERANNNVPTEYVLFDDIRVGG